MNKAEIVTRIAQGTGLTKVETEAVVEGFIASIVEAMQRGDHIELRGFGTFKLKTRAPRIARNPRTGASVSVPQSFTPTFKASRDLRLGISKGFNKL